MTLMPSFPVLSFCAYPGTVAMGNRQQFHDQHWSAKKFVNAIKGDTINGDAHILVRGRACTLTDANKEQAFLMFRDLLVEHRGSLPDGEVVIPVPSSNCCSEPELRTSRTYRLAEMVAEVLGIRVSPGVLFRIPALSSRKGGDRDSDLLVQKLSLAAGAPHGATAVLVDDVITSGGHLRATEWVLRTKASIVVSGAVCVARTVDTVEHDPFAVRRLPLERIRALEAPSH